MKRLVFIIVTILIAFPSFSQEEKIQTLENLENNTEIKSSPEIKPGKEPSHKKDTVSVQVGNEIFSVKGVGDETRIRLGKKEYRIVEDDHGVVVTKSSENNSHCRKHDRFRGHLGGIEFGFNNFATENFNTSLKPEDSYFDLNTGKSNNWNLLLPCVNIGFTKHFGIAATLGISFNKYRFDGNNTIVKDADGVINPYYPPIGITYSRTKLATTYAILPVLLEAQIPASGNHRNINLGAGVIGALKLGSHTKVVYYTPGGKQKEKNRDDFSLNPLRWGATVRIGYEFFQIYSTYYFTQLFEQGKGPELFPFEVGIAFTFNN